MSLDRDLFDSIKMNFVDYSSARLQEIAQSQDQQQWSAEALTAAREVLLDREAGRSQDPLIAKEPAPSGPTTDPYSLALLFGLMAISPLAGFVAMASLRNRDGSDLAPDEPVPFGSKVAWLAVDSTDAQAVATALGLREVREATWAQGIEAAYQSSVFVTPPVGQWTLVVSTALFPPDRTEAFVKPLLERLSRQFRDVQYFCTHQDVELHTWARALNGRLLRGFGWLGEKNLVLWNEGALTKEERALGFRFTFRKSQELQQGVSPASADLAFPNESCVMQLAFVWSIDPTTLNEQYMEPVMGLLGSAS